MYLTNITKTNILLSLKYILALFLFLVFIFKVESQGYNVSSFQKINETNGNFSIALDNEDNFGISSDYIGDINGDGFEDLAVGAYTDDDGGLNRGALYILFLDGNNNVISETKISDTQGNFTGILDNDDRFGGAVSYLGDINNDGSTEIAVAADYDGDGGFWHGAVWILSLNTDGTVISHSKISDTQGGFNGFINGDAIFGTDIENIGDLNGDGIDDLAVGSRRDGDGGARRGAVWILFMNANLTVNAEQKISNTQGNFNGVLQFEDYFGGSIANLGDLNDDGITDIAVGTYRDDDGQQNAGSFYILFLNANGTVSSHQKVSNTVGGLTSSISSDALFGESIDGVVDIDNDGKIEIVVGAMKQINPTLSVPTGAFFIIELNNDGTVSENHLYTHNENCFPGQLTNDDLFGGSVSMSKTGTTLNSIAVGAYRDSENGYRRGAMWILELGAATNYQVSQINPTVCGSFDGSITFSGFIPNQSYTVSFDHDGQNEVWILDTNSSGEIILTNLNIGFYINISIAQSNNLSCSINVADIELTVSSMDFDFTVNSNSDCDGSTGSILISSLAPNTLYFYDYELNGIMTSGSFTSNTNGEWIITGLEAGDYEFIMVVDNVSPCTDGIGLLTIIGNGLNAGINTINPTLCGQNDGSIIFNNLTTGLNYTISYVFNGNTVTLNEIADAVDEIYINLLGAGVYENIIITEDMSGCTQDIGNITLDDALVDYIFYSNPLSSCNTSDASIIISGLIPNNDHDVSYNFNGMTITNLLISNASGEIILSGLVAGTYENIIVINILDSCTDTEAEIIIGSLDFSITVQTQQLTSCIANDGVITISDLSPNENFTINYTFNSVEEVLNLVSDSSGIISISNLSNGTYTFSVTENSSGCIDSVQDILLENTLSDFIFMVNPATICSVSNGSIIILNLDSNSNYQITYTYNTVAFDITLSSNASGVLEILNLPFGNYLNLVVENVVTGCTDSENMLFVDADPLQVSIGALCEDSIGFIALSDLSANSEFQISYTFLNNEIQSNVFSDSNGYFEIDNLENGVYSEITLIEVVTGCSNSFSDQEINCSETQIQSTKCFDTKQFFTPNGDTTNEYWSLINVQESCRYTLNIFDRYGKLLKNLNNSRNKWDGTYNGLLMPSNDYWYTVEYFEGANISSKIYKSHFALKR